MSAPAAVGDGIAVGGDWSFSGLVVDRFDVHVARSVPGYATGHALVEGLSDFFVGSATVYDLGCSTGTLLARLAHRHAHRGASFVGVDVEPDMVTAAAARLAGLGRAVTADLREFPLERADLVVDYYGVQFLPFDGRAAVLRRVYRALRPGGALVTFAKTLAGSAAAQDVIGQLYESFKLTAGYEPAAVLAKAASLRGVLRPATAAQCDRMLTRAGFTSVSTVYQHLGFRGVLAIKDGC